MNADRKSFVSSARDDLIVVIGPTASGKSELAMQLAEELGGEIVGADSVQIYRHFDIGSGKPTTADRARVPHHVVDVCDPLEPIDAAHFVALADAAILDIRARGARPIVCGGTFLWVKALLFGLAELPAADAAIRAAHEDEAARRGRPALHEKLATVDPAAAARLAPNDLVRVSRALEVFELTGRTLTEWHADHQFRTVRHPAALCGVTREPTELDARIRARTRRWLEAGWIDEVRQQLDDGLGGARAMDAVGFRQVREHVRGDVAREDLEEAVVRATRRFARRQRTWLREQPVTWLAPPTRSS